MKKAKVLRLILKENISWCKTMIENLESKKDIEYFQAKLDTYEELLDIVEKL
ncbi:MAG: hypothetical protein J6B01_04475 [Ruminococcus sp.]|nr:hypothetical protein [Ruminococcus sp.]